MVIFLLVASFLQGATTLRKFWIPAIQRPCPGPEAPLPHVLMNTILSPDGNQRESAKTPSGVAQRTEPHKCPW